MTKEELTGMVPPVVVPFTAMGELDEAAFRQEIRYLIDHDIDGSRRGVGQLDAGGRGLRSAGSQQGSSQRGG